MKLALNWPSIILLGVVGVTLILLAFYYFFILQPRLVIPKALVVVEQIADRHKSPLLQHRLALIGLASLHPGEATFSSESRRLIDLLPETLKKVPETSTEVEPLKVPNASGDIKQFFAEWEEARRDLAEKEKNVVSYHASLAADLQATHSIFENILSYNAAEDLKPGDEQGARLESARDGLARLEVRVQDLPRRSGLKIEDVQTSLRQAREVVASGDVAQSIVAIEALQDEIWQFELSFLTLPSSTQIVSDQSNIIAAYDTWIKRANAWQIKLAQER